MSANDGLEKSFGSPSLTSPLAEVATTGTITIPFMKETGYRPHVAAAIEAVAATGGMIMPPVMGEVAFLIAENLGISYFAVAKAAALPAILWSACTSWWILRQPGEDSKAWPGGRSAASAMVSKEGVKGFHDCGYSPVLIFIFQGPFPALKS